MSMTPAIRVLAQHKVGFELHPYKYVEKGGTKTAAEELKFIEHAIIKTLVMEDDSSRAFIVLMHGDKEVSTRNLARHLKVRTCAPCPPARAEKLTGYMTGGISPFGTKQKLPVYAEESIFSLPEILINAGKRGLLMRITPDALGILNVEMVSVAI